MANPWIGKSSDELNKRMSEVGKTLERASSGEVQLSQDAQKSLTEELVQLTEAFQKAEACVNRNADVGWMRENIETCKTYLHSESYAYWKTVVETDFSGPNPCGTTVVATISKGLQKLFKFLKSVKKYYNEFVQPALNTITGLQETVKNITELISGALRILIQRARNWLIQKIKNLLSDALNSILPNLAKNIKNAVIKQIIDTIFCKFGEIISGLFNMVSGFLMSLIGNMINAPFCAARQFTNALINNLANRIDEALKPILDQVNSIVGSVGKIAGSIFEAIDFVLGFEAFLCSNGPECPENKDFAASIWGGPQEQAADRFKNFLDGLNLSSGETSDLLNQFDRWTGEWGIFKGDGNAIDSSVNILGDQLDANCDSGVYRCGPPKVLMFGGGGVGAAGDAIVNELGQIVGVNLKYGGQGYDSPPFVSFMDNCGNGDYASGYAVLDDDPTDDNEYDEITLTPIGRESTDDGGGITDIDGATGTRGGCIYEGKVYREFDNISNTHLNSEISSDINVTFKGKDIPDRTVVTFANNQKHYSVKFAVPYDSDDYQIDFTKVSNLPATGVILGGINPEVGVTFEVTKAAVYNTYLHFDSPGFPRVTIGPENNLKKAKFYRNVKYTVSSETFDPKGKKMPAAEFKIVGSKKLVLEDIRGLGSDRDFDDLVASADKGIFLDEGDSIRFAIYESEQGREREYLVAGVRNKNRFGFDVWFGVQRTDQPEGRLFSSYVREFSFKAYGQRENCQKGRKVKKVIMVNNGNGYLSAPNGRDEFDNILDDTGSTNTNEYVGCLTEIQVVSTGIGYSPDDEIVIEPDLPGLEVKVQLTEIGQIVAMIVVNGYCGLTEFPTITINSKNGAGAELRPVIDYVPNNQFAGDLQGEVVKVIDCVYK